VIEMSTGDPLETDRLAADLAALGLRCMDAPVGRTPRHAAEGKALIMAGGSAADLAQARPLFEAMADEIVHVGPLGSAIRLKLVNNNMSMVSMVLTGEALMFAAKLGLDRATVVKVLSNTTAGRGQLLTNFPHKVLAGDITPDFPLRMGHKDIHLAMNLAAKSFNEAVGPLSRRMMWRLSCIRSMGTSKLYASKVIRSSSCSGISRARKLERTS